MFRTLTVVTIAMLMVSCRSFKRPPSIPPQPVPAPAPTPIPEPEPPPPPAAGDVRISIAAPDGIAAFHIIDQGEVVGRLEAGRSLQWDRPAGIVHLQASPVSNGQAEVRFLGLLLPGEQSVRFNRGADGRCDFEQPATLRLTKARALPRLRTRAKHLPRETAVRFLRAHLFAAPVPGRLRRGYADAAQEIVSSAQEPTLTWTRYTARRASDTPARSSEEHPLSEFVDADIKLGITARVALRRHAKDIEPAQAFFRLKDSDHLGAKLESLVTALLASCPKAGI